MDENFSTQILNETRISGRLINKQHYLMSQQKKLSIQKILPQLRKK